MILIRKEKLGVSYMINFLVRNPTIVLKDVIVCGSNCQSNLLCDWKKFGQLLIRDFVKLGSMEFWDYKLEERAMQASQLDDSYP